MSEYPEYSHLETQEQSKEEIPLNLRNANRRQEEVAKAWERFLETGDDSFWFWDVPSSDEPKHTEIEYDLETEI